MYPGKRPKQGNWNLVNSVVKWKYCNCIAAGRPRDTSAISFERLRVRNHIHMYVCMCMCKVCVCHLICVCIPYVCRVRLVCQPVSPILMSLPALASRLLGRLTLTITRTLYRTFKAAALLLLLLLVYATLLLPSILLPSEVAFKRISPSAITVVQKCQLFWLLKRVPDRRTPRGAMALWSLVPAASLLLVSMRRARMPSASDSDSGALHHNRLQEVEASSKHRSVCISDGIKGCKLSQCKVQKSFALFINSWNYQLSHSNIMFVVGILLKVINK